MNKEHSFKRTFGSLVAAHRVWNDTTPALRMAADEAVRASGLDPVEQTAALCRAMRCGEDDGLPTADEAAWQRAKLEALTGLANQSGRRIIAYFFETQQIVGNLAGRGLYDDDYILVEFVGDARLVIASSFCDDFEFGPAARDAAARQASEARRGPVGAP